MTVARLPPVASDPTPDLSPTKTSVICQWQVQDDDSAPRRNSQVVVSRLQSIDECLSSCIGKVSNLASNCKWTLVSLWTLPGTIYTPHSIYGVSKLLAKTVFRAGRVRLLQSLTTRCRYRNSIGCGIDSKSVFLGPSSTVQKTMISRQRESKTFDPPFGPEMLARASNPSRDTLLRIHFRVLSA